LGGDKNSIFASPRQTANNNMGGDALDEDQNHDIVARCLSGHANIPHTLCKELKIINLAAYITNLLFLKTKKPVSTGKPN
jgi:hypothetical protein